MSSPSKRPKRQLKSGAQEAQSDKAEKSDKKRGLQKSGKSAPETEPQISETNSPSTPPKPTNDIEMKNKSPAIPSSPPTAVRRSGRAPVPSSRFKDMEVTTPSASRKRSIANFLDEPDKEQESPKKRVKKQSKNAEAEVKSPEIQAYSTEASEKESTDTESTKIPVCNTAASQDSVSSPQAKSVQLQLSNEEVHSNTEATDKDDDKNISENVLSVEPEAEEERNEPISVEEMLEKSLQEGKISKSDLETKLTAKLTEEEKGNADLKSKEVSLDTESEESENKPAEVIALPEMHVSEEAHTPGITIGSQNVTFEERNGETVAIVTISSGIEETPNQVLTEANTDLGETANHSFTEIISVIPNSHGGHTVVTDKSESSVAEIEPSKLTVEARQFSSLLKAKPRTTNPVSGHGRVIPRNEQATSMMFKSSVGSPSLAQSASLITVAPAQDGLPQRGGKKYSLLPPLPQKTPQDPSKTPLHGSITTRNSPKVIIVNQKAPDTTAGTHISTLKSPTQLNMPVSGNSSTIIHVKKAQNTSLTASDLECVLKAISGKSMSETEIVPGADKSISIDVTEKESASANVQYSENTEVKEGLLEPSTELEGDAGVEGDLIQTQGEEKLDTNKENLTQDTMTEDRQQTEQEEDSKESTTIETTHDNNVTKEPGEATVLNDTKQESPSENLPVESALYQALQALEPTNMTGDQISNAEDTENGVSANLEMTDPKTVEGDNKLSSSEKWTVKGETIKVVDNGIEYDVRIVCQEDVTEEIIDDSSDQVKTDKVDEMSFKEEGLDESIGDESGMQTSGTQTLYNVDKGSAIPRMTTVVDKDGQKKQVYYVSVFPGKGVLNRVKSNQGARLTQASWVLSENGLYCCGKCNYKTDRKANFYKHRRLHIGAKPHICPVCQYKAGTSSNLKRHMGIHKDIREHKCDICGLCFRQKIHLERHIKYKHEVKSVHCPLCDYVCANEQPDLKMHMKRKHSSGRSGEMLKCPECDVEVGSKKDLKQHMKFHKDGPELKLFCKECSFVTDCQSRLRRHAAIHSKLKPFQCGVCPYRAAQKEHVLRHLRTQHKIEVKREVKKTWKSKKQPEQEEIKTEKADFTSGDKIFACNHCTMRFAKLINLYKHLHTQHSDIMPAETSGNYYCVVCEFSTATKKNLLVHMRRHNVTDQTPPTHVYSCVLCRYVNPKRRNLFQHMRKKHNIDISNQPEDEAETQVLDMGDVIKTVKDEVLSTQDAGTNVAAVVGSAGSRADNALTAIEIHETNNRTELGNLSNMIKIEDLTDTNSNPAPEGDDNMATLVIDTRAGDAQPIQIVQAANANSLIQQQQHSLDALEGLQALAEQAGLVDNVIEEQVTSLDQSQHQAAVIIDRDTSAEEGTDSNTTDVVEIVSGGEHLQELQNVTLEATEDVDIADSAEFGGMELSEEQLSSLRHGDMVEMDGELYVVEMTSDPEQPNKQILSFVPVSATSVDDQG